MKKTFLTIAAVITALLLVSCGTTKETVFASMYDEKPETILIMPPINYTDNVEAKDYFYTTMNVPLAEAGYYVLPPAAVYSTLQRESAYDAERFIDGDLSRFKKLFGADIAVFTIIKSWKKSVVGSSITINVEYIFKSTKTNDTLFRRDADIICDTSTGMKTNSLLGSLLIATANAVKTAVTDYVSVAVQCNRTALQDLPAGKYSPKYGKDQGDSAFGEYVRITASK